VALRRPKAETGDLSRTALTAATAMVDLSVGSSWKTYKFGNRDWQVEAWRLYDIVPELHFLAGRIGDSVAKARLYVTEVDETGEETGETQDEVIRQLAAVPLGKGAQRDDNLRLAGLDLAVPGECWIIGEGAAQRAHEASGAWFVVTGAALKNEGGKVKVRRPKHRGDGWLELTDGVDVMIRCHRPHPNDTDQADSFTRSAIPVLREIELLTKREFAELDSRLTGAGIMPVPESMDFPRKPEDAAGLDGFMAYMQRAMSASMIDQSSASAMVPIVFSVPDQLMADVDKIRPITFWSELSDQIGDMKDKAIGRLGTTAEIPKEVLEGIGNSNHWTAWLISDEGTRWIGGYLTLIADALTRGFLALALKAMGREADIGRYAFAFDTSPLAARPNRIEEAAQLHDRFLISDKEMVKAAAFPVEVMPTVKERAQQILLKLIQAQPDLILDPAVQAALGLPQVESAGLPPTAEQNIDGDPQDDPDERVLDSPPNGGTAPALTASILDRRIAELQAAPPAPQVVFNTSCRLHVLRALELAGGRLATPAERAGKWRDIPRHELHAQIGPISPSRAETVTRGSWAHIEATATDFGVPADRLEQLLSGYVTELLTRGMRHHDDLLFAALEIANRGRGLVSA